MADAARAVMVWHEGDHDHARALFMEALQADARDDRDDADQSLPNPVKPVAELFGDMLLASGDAKGAQAQFQAVLERHARRPVALLGLARALETQGETQAAACRYAELAAIWREADDDMSGLSEARMAAANTRRDCVPEEKPIRRHLPE
jgi:predicted Zn-dependent protease